MIPIVLAPPRTGGSGSSQSSACVRPAAPVPNDSVRALAGAGRATPWRRGRRQPATPRTSPLPPRTRSSARPRPGRSQWPRSAGQSQALAGRRRRSYCHLRLRLRLVSPMRWRNASFALDKSVARTAATAHSKERKFLPTSAVPSWPGRRRSGDCGWLRARDPGSSSSRSRAEPVTRPWRSRRWHLVGSVPRPSRGSPCWGDRVPFCATCWTFGATPRLGLGVPAARPSLLRQLRGLAENCACEPWNGCFDLAGRHGPGFNLSSFHRKDNHAPRQPV